MDKTVGLFPIRDERIAVFTAHRAPDSAIPADPRMVVQTTYSDLGWLVPDALAHCPDPPALYYDQVSQIVMPRWTTDRIAPVADKQAAGRRTAEWFLPSSPRRLLLRRLALRAMALPGLDRLFSSRLVAGAGAIP